MTSITVRNIEDDLKRRLRIRAAEHGHSMEEEARRILRSALGEELAPAEDSEKGLGTKIHELFAPIGGVDGIEFPKLEGPRPARFDQQS